MNEKQQDLLEQRRSMNEDITQLEMEYWKLFSDFGAWQFWVMLMTLIVPLIVLFMFIDRNRMLLLGFFGMNYHLWFKYANDIGIMMGFWEYPYEAATPLLPSIELDGSLAAVAFMLIYQWTLNHNKNIYLYATLLSAVFAFIIMPVMVNFEFFFMFKGADYFHLFLLYLVVAFVSLAITRLFSWMQYKG